MPMDHIYYLGPTLRPVVHFRS